MRRTTRFIAPLALLLGSLAAQSAPAQTVTPETLPPGIPPDCMLIDDIIVPRDFFTDRATYGGGTIPWDRHVVPYAFHTNITTLNRTRAIEAMNEIEAVCGVKFVPFFGQPNYIMFRSSGFNASYVGRVGGIQVIDIVSWSVRFVIVHELLHALGAWHEQQRPDRDAFVNINVENIQPGQGHNFGLIESASTFGTYDFESLMHYDACSFSICCPAGSTCGCPSGCETITPLPAYQVFQDVMGQRSHMSEGDIDWLVYVYGEADCNHNGVHDYYDIQSGFSQDCNANGVPDECDIHDAIPTYSDEFHGFTEYSDCNANGLVDSCDLELGNGADCNANGVLDECDIANGTSQDVNGDGEPDDCTIPPGPFSIVSPANGSTGVSTGPALDWSDSPEASDYLVEIDTGPTFAAPIHSEIVDASKLTLSEGTLNGFTTYFWRVTAQNVGGTKLSNPNLVAFTTGASSLCIGDVNGDNETNVFDFVIFTARFAQTGVTPGTDGDLDLDGDVDVFDFALFVADFGCPN